VYEVPEVGGLVRLNCPMTSYYPEMNVSSVYVYNLVRDKGLTLSQATGRVRALALAVGFKTSSKAERRKLSSPSKGYVKGSPASLISFFALMN
jgi:hypothetical protein